ncbi:MAG: hypothetical protein WKF48_05730 [Solirubrobacteraceae bacterium]
MTPPADDVFGDVVDVDTIEEALRETLEAWLPAHLAHQERRRGLTAGTLPQPKSWPMISEVDLEPNAQLPAIIIASPGSAPGLTRNQKGEHRKTWRFEVVVALGDSSEKKVRKLASMYLAAVIGALVQNTTLGDRVLKCINVGPDDHAVGVTTSKRRRALYGTAFEVTIRDAVNDTKGTAEPPADPYNPDPFPLGPNEAEIIVTASLDTP